jgi:hypothetical protein
MTREELREKVARAICKAVGLDICDDGCALCPTCLTEADAAIAIIRAGVLEEAARVVRRMPSPSSEWMADELLRALGGKANTVPAALKEKA